MSLPSSKKGIIYIKDNGAMHPDVGARVFGGSRTSGSQKSFPKIEVIGGAVKRTWSLLSKTGNIGDTYIRVMHDVSSMGWKVGDRIVISTTRESSKGDAQGGMYIKSIDGNRINLAANPALTVDAKLDQVFKLLLD